MSIIVIKNKKEAFAAELARAVRKNFKLAQKAVVLSIQ
jgi:hypothetical protein